MILEKIGLVLGDKFVTPKKTHKVKDVFAQFEYENVDDFNEKIIYTIRRFDMEAERRPVY